MQNLDKLIVRTIAYNSSEYVAALALRDKILRQPLGMSLYDEDLSQDQKDFHFAAIYLQQVVGTVLLSPLITGELKMRQVAIDKQYQSMKIGSKMLAYTEHFAREQGYTTIVLNARKTALEFYTKNGYHLLSDEFFEVGIPHYKMSKKL